MIKSLNGLSADRYAVLYEILETLNGYIKDHLRRKMKLTSLSWFSPTPKSPGKWWTGWEERTPTREVLSRVRLPIPEGFAITTRAYELLLGANDLVDEINKIKMQMDPNDPNRSTPPARTSSTAHYLRPRPRELEIATWSL